VKEVLAGIGLLFLMGAMTHLSVEAVVAQEERDEAVAAARRAEAAATSAVRPRRGPYGEPLATRRRHQLQAMPDLVGPRAVE